MLPASVCVAPVGGDVGGRAVLHISQVERVAGLAKVQAEQVHPSVSVIGRANATAIFVGGVPLGEGECVGLGLGEGVPGFGIGEAAPGRGEA